MNETENLIGEDESRFSLTRVWARNFKSIRDLDLELGPLTVLVGPNASGKSNVLDVLRFIKQSVGRYLDSAVTSRHGIEAVRRATPRGGTRDVEVGFEVRKGEFRMRYGFVLGSRTGVYRVKREYGTVTPSNPELKPINYEIRDGKLVKPNMLFGYEYEDSELALPSLVHILIRTQAESHESRIRAGRIASIEVAGALNFVRDMQFYRIFPDAIREPRRPMNSRNLVEDGQNLASVLRAMIKWDSPYLEEIKDSLGQVVPGLQDLVVQQSGGYLIVKLRHGVVNNGGRGALFDLSQESDGTVRLLGLLTAFYQEMPELLLGVEEPELTIHPGALAVLADVMVEASNRSQVVATTHSPDLIDRLPIESLRAVQIRDGCTEVGPVSETQSKAVMNGLFTTGELHSMEGLVPRS